jgi:DNA-directed RNA polymerase subunit D
MKLSILEETETSIKVLIEGTSPDFVNAIRRTLLLDVPKLAIEHVTIYDNTSALFDEIVAHRLGLLPLPTDLDALVFREDCVCEGEGCPNCTVHYTVSKEGECTVYSSDLNAEDSSWAIKDEQIPILRLLKEQRVILEAEAVLGTGKQHAKWQTVSGAGYSYYPHIEISEACNVCRDCIKKCPRNILAIKKGKVVVQNLENCSLCKTCAEICGQDAISVSGDPTRIIFQFETDGALTARRALQEALTILHDAYDGLGQGLA